MSQFEIAPTLVCSYPRPPTALHPEKSLLYILKYFAGDNTTRKIHTKLQPGPKQCMFHIFTTEDVDDAISRFSQFFLYPCTTVSLSIQFIP